MYSTLHCQKHFPEHFHLATSQSRVPMALTAAKPFSSPQHLLISSLVPDTFLGTVPTPVQHEDKLPALTELTFLKDKTDTKQISRQFQVIVLLLVTQPCPILCYPTDCSLPGSSVDGILEARILEWVAIPFSKGFSWPRNWTQVFHTTGRFLTSEPSGKPKAIASTNTKTEKLTEGMTWRVLRWSGKSGVESVPGVGTAGTKALTWGPSGPSLGKCPSFYLSACQNGHVCLPPADYRP